jgi:hemerythrin superfamily protein
MNAIQVLTRDHDEIKGLFGQFQETGKRAKVKKQQIAEKVIKELKAHSQMEERLFYPRCREQGDEEMRDLVLEGIEEHRVADFGMERLQQTEPGDETYDAKFKVLMESVQHHIGEEEKELFPRAKKLLADELDSLGQQLEQMHERLE